MTKNRGHFLILDRDDFRCVYCGSSPTDDQSVVMTVDHILPVQKGGSDRADNLVASCLNCNSQKQDRLFSEETLSRYAALAKKRNVAAGIPDHQIIRLKSSSANIRTRGEWDQLTSKFLRVAFNLLTRDHDMLGAERAASVAEIFCLAIEATTEYRRLTADSERAKQVAEMLREMAIDVSVAACADLTPYRQPDRNAYIDNVDYHLRKLDDVLLGIWLGPYGAGVLAGGYIQSGRAKVSDIRICGENIATVTDSDAEPYVRSWQQGRDELRQFWKEHKP